uniref:Glucose-6-phosphate isomerase n=1 Tax=Rhizophora mucronata TaxID=61149 RepID=A0A2P2K208_RHIMU
MESKDYHRVRFHGPTEHSMDPKNIRRRKKILGHFDLKYSASMPTNDEVIEEHLKSR